jgi:hypothetical protein
MLPKYLNCLASHLLTLNVPDEENFQKRVVRTKFEIYVFII